MERRKKEGGGRGEHRWGIAVSGQRARKNMHLSDGSVVMVS